MTDKEIPKIEAKGGALTVTITAEELKWIAEQNPRTSYKVLDADLFLNHFAANLEEYQDSNAKETGCSALQMFFERIIDETYTNGSEALIDPEEKL